MLLLISRCNKQKMFLDYAHFFYPNWHISYISLAHIKIGYFCLLSSIVLKYVRLSGKNTKICSPKFKSRSHRILNYLLLYLLLLNFILIGIVNPSLLNPGPKCLKISYQNVQGLIPFKDLSLKQPSLDQTKIYELNNYINKNKPDIFILNETWLKKSIGDREVVKDDTYEVFRNDRTHTTHPPDPNDPKKFRTSGGGMLIAIRLVIQAEIKNISVRKGAEIKAIEVTIDNRKYIFCTAYRVGNLGETNHTSIVNTLKSFFKVRNPRKIFFIGDINLSTVSWPISEDKTIRSRIDKLFVDSFFELGMYQYIVQPTHIKGRTLDLLITNSKSCISNINVFPDKDICSSDHYLITFEVNAKIEYKKVPKRKILNYKKANWSSLNDDLASVNWTPILDCLEPELAWKKSNIFYLL